MHKSHLYYTLTLFLLSGIVAGLIAITAITWYGQTQQARKIEDLQTLSEEDGKYATLEESLQNRLKKIEAQLLVATPSPEPTPSQTYQKSQSSAKKQQREAIIYLGEGSTTNRTWTDMTGASAYIDLGNYPNITLVTFEASLSIISGEVYARIRAVNQNQVLHDSEVSNNTSQETWKQSPNIRVFPGSQEYRVQLRSSNGEQANLHAARLRIVYLGE